MPDLGELAQEYAEKGVQIVGIVGDVMNSDGTLSESQLEKAAQIVEQTGANYVHIPMDLELYFSDLGENLYAFPTTYFVDSEGKPCLLYTSFRVMCRSSAYKAMMSSSKLS